MRQENGLLLRWMGKTTDNLVKISIGRSLEIVHPNHLDIYMIAWLFIQVAIVILLLVVMLQNPLKIILTILLCYRLVEIGVANFDSVFISVMQKKKHRSVPRLFSLILVNYVEVILIFGIIFDFLSNQTSLANSYLYSVSLATLSGTSINSQDYGPIIAAIVEMLFGVFFVTGAIAAVANYLGSKE